MNNNSALANKQPQQIINRVLAVCPVGWKRRHKIAWALVRENDSIFGVRWLCDGKKYTIHGLNVVEDGKYKEVTRKTNERND